MASGLSALFLFHLETLVVSKYSGEHWTLLIGVCCKLWILIYKFFIDDAWNKQRLRAPSVRQGKVKIFPRLPRTWVTGEMGIRTYIVFGLYLLPQPPYSPDITPSDYYVTLGRWRTSRRRRVRKWGPRMDGGEIGYGFLQMRNPQVTEETEDRVVD